MNIYGIKNCDTCRKALKWLDAQGIEYSWIDVRDADVNGGLDKAKVKHWLSEVGPEQLVNRRSTSWRQLEPERRPQLDSDEWVEVLVEMPTLIKRPIFEGNNQVRVGFSDDVRSWLSTQ